eukprot:sb/3467186/
MVRIAPVPICSVYWHESPDKNGKTHKTFTVSHTNGSFSNWVYEKNQKKISPGVDSTPFDGLGECDPIHKVAKSYRKGEKKPVVVFCGGLPHMYYMDKQTVTVVLTGEDGEKFHTLECPSKPICSVYWHESPDKNGKTHKTFTVSHTNGSFSNWVYEKNQKKISPGVDSTPFDGLGECDPIHKVAKSYRKGEKKPVVVFCGGLPHMYYMDKQTVTVVLTGEDGEKFHTLECPSKDNSTGVDNHFCILWSALDISILIYPHRLSKFYDQEITCRDQPQSTRTIAEINYKDYSTVWIFMKFVFLSTSVE